MNEILIIDDQADIRALVADILHDEGYKSLHAHNVASALEQLQKSSPKVIILDIWLEGSQMDGIGLLRLLKKQTPAVPVIMISGHGNIETAVQTIKLGAYDFIEKPFKSERLVILVKRAIEAGILLQENDLLKRKLGSHELIGDSKEMRRVCDTVKTFASTNSHVVIIGEAGTGKATIAQIMHESSKREHQPFVIWHTANKSLTELSLELFGGLPSHHVSLIEQAYCGTLFIDEITNIPLVLQKQLLQILQSESFLNPHNHQLIKFDSRIIIASSHNPIKAIQDNLLNENFYHRVNIVSIEAPPLREHKQDIKPLTKYFVNVLCKEFSTSQRFISEEAYSIMLSYNWPGNVRELRNTVEWLVMMAVNAGKQLISHDMLPYEILGAVTKQYKDLNPTSSFILSKPLKEAREMFEREYIEAQLKKFNGNIAKTASFIGMDRAALHRKIKSLTHEKTASKVVSLQTAEF